MTRFTKAVFVIFWLSHLSLAAAEVVSGGGSTLLHLDYHGFTIWLDCNRRGAVKFRYNTQRDQDDFGRLGTFFLDSDVLARCQQTFTGSYQHPNFTDHRGHLVPASHLDNSENAIRQSHYMTNMLPPTQTLNLGAWKQTETITECYRDIDELLVIGGVIWGNDTTNDHFTQSHGVATPDAYWKRIIRGTERVIAWMIPNTTQARSKQLDTYLVMVEELEWRTGESFPEVPALAKSEKPEVSWLMPIGCDQS